MLRLQEQEPQVEQLQHRHLPLLPVHQQAPLHGHPHLLREVSDGRYLGAAARWLFAAWTKAIPIIRTGLANCVSLLLWTRSLKMDRWKRKELKQMELGGNGNAHVFYEENGMFKDGKPDHEAPMHSRQKMDLS